MLRFLKTVFLFICIVSVPGRVAAQENEYPEYIWYKKNDTLRINKAVKLYESGSYETAKQELAKVSSKALEHAGCLRLFALCEFELGKYQSALDYFNMAIDREPNASRLFFERAETLL